MNHARAFVLLLLAIATGAEARSSGINSSVCYGCHSDGQAPVVALTASPSTFAPGAAVTLTVTIQALNGSNGGLYLRSNGVGTFALISGQNTRLVNSNEVVHSSPKAASNGSVTFQVRWTAPSTPGGVDLEVEGLSGNSNGAASGDNSGNAKLSLVWGCGAGNTYFRDMDLDGVGSAASGTTRNCATPAGFSTQDGDCNDNNELVYPGRTEACNGRDDDCDSQVDEGLSNVTTYKDADGDGYGRNDITQTGCGTGSGWAAAGNDCDDAVKSTHPGAQETCNLRDDDCDGQIDDGARIICGVGMCRRYGPTCDATQCKPGAAVGESCNGLDDDCNGADDDAEGLCAPGKVCEAAVCVEEPAGAGGGSAASGLAADGGGTTEPTRPSGNGGCDVSGGVLAVLAAFVTWRVRRRRG